jgi:hypothetical protein
MTATTRPVARTTWEAAATRAALAPAHRLPCPGCAASVRGANLTEHVHRVHLSGPTAMAPGHPIHVGVDRRVRRLVGVAVGGWLVALAALAATDTEPLTAAWTAVADEPTAEVARQHLEALARTAVGTALLAGLAVLVVGRLLRRTDRAQARLAVTDREVVLRHRVGTGTARVRLPARVETGTLVRHHGASGGGEGSGDVTEAHDERVGSYLRVGTGRRAITVGCTNGTRMRKHWAGWESGPTRRRWDVTLAPAEFVAFQYALAQVGVLVPRLG